MAEVYKAQVSIVFLPCAFEKAAGRQTHGVPLDKLWLMYQTLQTERLPSHWKQEIVFTD